MAGRLIVLLSCEIFLYLSICSATVSTKIRLPLGSVMDWAQLSLTVESRARFLFFDIKDGGQCKEYEVFTYSPIFAS